MDVHSIELPREILIGEDVLQKTNEICSKIGLKGSALLLAGPNTMEIAGKTVLANLREAGYFVEARIVDTIDKIKLDEFLEQTKNFNFILGVGGGRIIDTAKYLSHRLKIPFISVPTTASHDGIASSRATLNNNGSHYSYAAQAPVAIIIDMNIIAKSPYRFIASGCADIMAKLTAVSDWKLAHETNGEYFSEYAATLALLSAEIVVNSAELIKEKDMRGLRNLMEALISSGVAMCIAGTSRPASGSEHLFSHALDIICEKKTCLHGEQCGIGTIIAAYMHGLQWERIREKLRQLGCPTTARELGVDAEHVIKALVMAKEIRKDRYTIFHGLDMQNARKIATITGIIS